MRRGEQEEEPGQRRAQAEARREQLLEIALDLFSRKGLRGATIREIARRAEITEGLIYHYFASKDELVTAVMRRYHFGPRLIQLLEELGDVPVEEALFRVGTRFLELLTEKRQLVHMVFAEVRNNPGFGKTLGSVMMGILQRLTEFMEERIARGELRPHDTTLSPRVFMGGLFWYFFVHQNLTPNVALVTPERFTRFAVSALLQGLGSEDLRGADEGLTALLASGSNTISSKGETP